MAELYGGGTNSCEILQTTERGLRRNLYSPDMLAGYQPDAAQGARELNASGSVFVCEAGLFEPNEDIADSVDEGEIVGQKHYPETLWKSPDPVCSPCAGIMLCAYVMVQVQQGDAVYQIAADVK